MNKSGGPGRSFEETRQAAGDALDGMRRDLVLMRRAHRSYLKHGAVNAASEMRGKIEDLERGIGFEEGVCRRAFY